MSYDGDFDEDFRWQRQFLEHQKEVALNAVRVEVAPVEDDLMRNTDLVLRTTAPTKSGRPMSFSARVRRHKYRHRKGDFTIRKRRQSGVATEIDKLRLGDGDWFIYGFEAEPGSDRMHPWFIGNLELLRLYDREGGYHETRQNKGPYGSEIAVFYHDDMPPGFLQASQGLDSVFLDDTWGRCRKCYIPMVTAMKDPLTPGDGPFRQCLFCGFRWRSGWTMPHGCGPQCPDNHEPLRRALPYLPRRRKGA